MRRKEARIPDFPSIHTNAGSPIHKILEPRFNGLSTRLVEVGVENIQERIEAEAPYTDINYMLHRLSLGDSSVLSGKRPLYGDFSGLPSDPIEAINLVHESERAFARLSVEDKLKYNNDWKKWFSDLLSGRSKSVNNSVESVKSAESVESDPEA